MAVKNNELKNAIFASTYVTVVFSKNVSSGLSFMSFKLPRIQKGDKVRVPRPLADLLVSRGIAILSEEDTLTLSEINKTAWIELRSDELTKLRPDFYLEVARLVKTISEQISKGDLGVAGLRRLQIVKATAMDIAKCRLNKLLKIVYADPTPSRKILDLLTPEERELYIKLCQLVGSWIESMKTFVEADNND